MEPIELTGVLQNGDRRAIGRAYWAMHMARYWAWFAVTIALMSFSLLVDHVAPAPLRWLPGVCGGVIFWLTYFRQRDLPWLDMRFAFSDERVEAEGNGALVRYPWGRVKGYRIDRGVLLLMIDNGVYMPVVQRWATAEQWERVLALVRQRSRPM